MESDLGIQQQSSIMDNTKDYDVDSSSSEEDSDDENELKKLQTSINKDNLLVFHPEIEQINYNELITLSKIVRDKHGNPIDPLHTTVPFLTKYEKSRVLGLRSKQINSGSEIFVDVPPSIFDGYAIAELELEQKKIPFIIRRPLPNGVSEYWSVNDLQQI
jgi:DNA-directed RNA polymerase I, II, and III subunit RPABC2